MTPTLFPYQIEGAAWLASKTVALLADDMGLGKSAQVIAALDQIRAERVMVVCPAAARVNWIREFQKFSSYPREYEVWTERKQKLSASKSVIASYDLASLSSQFIEGSFDALVLDEAHFLKTLETKRTKAILGREGLVRRAGRVWALTGTPAPNHPGELWPLLYTFGATTLKYGGFVDRYCESYETGYGRQIVGAEKRRIAELRGILAPLMLRRKKEEVLKDLPPIFFQDLTVEPGPVDIELIPSFHEYTFPSDRRDELEEKLAFERKKLEAADMEHLEALAQSVSTLRRYSGLQKVEPVADLIKEELLNKSYKKIVVFAIHRDVIEGLRSRLKDFGAVTLYGGTPPEKRQKHIDSFQRDAETKVFIGQIQAAGTALTLTAASNVLFVEQDWVPGNNSQAAMRCHRIGQQLPVFVRVAGLATSIDERIAQVLRRKMVDHTAIFDVK
jgi:SWI/SNF-related matrix-associated actin-dependent regulator of chromatin subfamily A-like protein 1